MLVTTGKVITYRYKESCLQQFTQAFITTCHIFFLIKNMEELFFPPYVNRCRSCAPQADRVEECPSPHQSAAAIASSHRSFPPTSSTVRRSRRPHQGNTVAQGINRRWEGETRGHSSSTAASVSPTLAAHRDNWSLGWRKGCSPIAPPKQQPLSTVQYPWNLLHAEGSHSTTPTPYSSFLWGLLHILRHTLPTSAQPPWRPAASFTAGSWRCSWNKVL